MTAQRPGKCFLCHEAILPGEEIDKALDLRWAHRECVIKEGEIGDRPDDEWEMEP